MTLYGHKAPRSGGCSKIPDPERGEDGGGGHFVSTCSGSLPGEGVGEREAKWAGAGGVRAAWGCGEGGVGAQRGHGLALVVGAGVEGEGVGV